MIVVNHSVMLFVFDGPNSRPLIIVGTLLFELSDEVFYQFCIVYILVN